MTDLATFTTAAAAVPAAVLLTQTAKALGLPGKWTRTFAVLAGLLIVVAATVASGAEAAAVAVSVLVGCEAGLAAWSAYDLAAGGSRFLFDA